MGGKGSTRWRKYEPRTMRLDDVHTIHIASVLRAGEFDGQVLGTGTIAWDGPSPDSPWPNRIRRTRHLKPESCRAILTLHASLRRGVHTVAFGSASFRQGSLTAGGAGGLRVGDV